MEIKKIIPEIDIGLFVKNILVFEEKNKSETTILPFYADGYPGIMFQETSGGLSVRPHNKKMPPLFLYGQTIQPIELVMEGAYSLIIFQLYPFVLKSFFGVHPKDINDNCYDLTQLQDSRINDAIAQLTTANELTTKLATITTFLYSVFQSKKDMLDFKIRQSLQIIIDQRGQVNITELCTQLKISARSFERRFLAAVGVSPKQLASIIRFDASLNQLNEGDYNLLTDIVYANGFADQSHFIRVFKAFTGMTPKQFGKR
ncbi:MAG: AraC family transcriptional regulator [Chitinophagaceae bacterium]